MYATGLNAVYPKPNLSRASKGDRQYPYILKDIKIERVNQAWAADNIYIEKVWQSLKYEDIYLKNYEILKKG